MALAVGKKAANSSACADAAALIPGFLDGTLNDRDLEAFLVHIRTCKKCYEELETNFMVDRAIKYLNEDMPTDTSFDLTPLLEKELQSRGRALRSKKRIERWRTVILVATLILIVLFLLDLTGLFHVTVFFSS